MGAVGPYDDEGWHREGDDPFTRLENAAEVIVKQTSWEQQNRLGLLAIHGVIGVLAGMLMMINGTATSFEVFGLWIRPALSGLSIFGGAVLLAGLISKPRNVRLEISGLALMGIWDLAMAVAFIVARTVNHVTYKFTFPWVALPDSSRLYPVVIYLGMFALICVHLWTLRKLRRGD